MIQIKSIKRLIYATSRMDTAAGPLMRNQVQNTKDRLNTGIDVSGNPFAPYKHPERFKGRRPLSRAASLFNDAQIGAVNSSLGGVEFRASISGRSAIIAFYQNIHRRFLGYNREDRREAKKTVVDTIKSLGRKC